MIEVEHQAMSVKGVDASLATKTPRGVIHMVFKVLYLGHTEQ